MSDAYDRYIESMQSEGLIDNGDETPDDAGRPSDLSVSQGAPTGDAPQAIPGRDPGVASGDGLGDDARGLGAEGAGDLAGGRAGEVAGVPGDADSGGRAPGPDDGRRRIYVASSWRNTFYPEVVEALNALGHLVYDFRNPAPGNTGFAWSDIDPEWLGWTPESYRSLLSHPVAQSGFRLDMDALDWCDTLVLVLPCGRSAHLELGYAVGQGKSTWVLLRQEGFEPELMYAMVGNLVCSVDELVNEMVALDAKRAAWGDESEEAFLASLMEGIEDYVKDVPRLAPSRRPVGGDQVREAALAWERWNPSVVSDPAYDAIRSAWIGGYLAALQRDTRDPEIDDMPKEGEVQNE